MKLKGHYRYVKDVDVKDKKKTWKHVKALVLRQHCVLRTDLLMTVNHSLWITKCKKTRREKPDGATRLRKSLQSEQPDVC